MGAGSEETMSDTRSGSRRDFLKLVTAGATLATASTHLLADETPDDKCKKVTANDRVGLALIGAGGQGNGDVRQALSLPGVELVAACDVYDGRLARAREVYCDQIFTTRDYRAILDRKDVDAVIIGTPDHLHMPIAVAAMEAGKDVYCEKPMIRLAAEGLKMVEAQKRTGRVLQVGSQRTSSLVYAKARELVASGAIGEINLVEAWWNRNTAIGAWQYTIPPDASPDNVDWTRFLGSAPPRPFEPIRLFRWRNYRDYGTGVAGDLFVHLFSGLHCITGSLGPTRVYATGGLRYWKDGRDVPDVMLGLYDYPKTDRLPEFTLSLKVNFADGAGGEEGFRFVGSEGVLTLGGDGISVTRRRPETEPGYTIGTFPKALQDAYLKDYRQKYPERTEEINTTKVERFFAPREYSDHKAHLRNFIECCRTRLTPYQDATFGLRAAGPAVLSNLSLWEKRPVAWDPESMTTPTVTPAIPAKPAKNG
jgi:predicted dehydrogenase